MILPIKKLIVSWLIQHNAIKENDRILYEYAVSSFFITLSPLAITIIIGAYMGMLKESLIVILPFMTIRKFSGGYHAKQLYSCLISSTCLLIICIKAVALIKCSILLSIITICAGFSLIILSPVDNKNRRLNIREKKYYKHIAIFITILFEIIYFALCIFKINTYAICISVGLILSAALQIPFLFIKQNT